MDTFPDNNNWIKLENLLDGEIPMLDGDALTEEEKKTLQSFREIRARLQPGDREKKFGVEEGWERFARASGLQNGTPETEGDKHGKVVSFFRFKYAAAIALFIMVAAAGYLWKQRSSRSVSPVNPVATKALLKPRNSVELVLADGKKITISTDTKSIKEKNGTLIDAAYNTVAYHPQPNKNEGKPETPLLYNTMIVPRGNHTKIVLSDGTQVWINADSKLTYPVEFTGHTREVKLEGEAYFKVAPNAQKPFIVHAEKMDTRVLGTAFNINTYEPVVAVTLEEGKVAIKTPADSLKLAPGEQARYNTNKRALQKLKVDTYPFTAWKDGDLYCNNLSFEDIARRLAREYDYTFSFENPSVEQLHFTVDMRSPEILQEVLDNISRTTKNVSFKVSGRMVVIK